MVFKIFNTLSRELEEFKPINNNKVGLYSCGPTVYNYAHIGNWRSFIFSDLLKRWLKYNGYEVNHIMNLTDVDDKTIRDSQTEKKSLKDFTEFYTKEFMKDMKALNIEVKGVVESPVIGGKGKNVEFLLWLRPELTSGSR